MKIIHLLSQPDTERERKSIECLSGLKNYQQIINPPYQDAPPDFCRRPNALRDKRVAIAGGNVLGPGHYGCFLAHKNAVLSEFDSDFLMICECDCIIDPNGFEEKVAKLCEDIIKHEIDYLSLGNSLWKRLEPLGQDLHLTNWISLTHCIIFPQAIKKPLVNCFNNMRWDTIDIWYSTLGLRMAVVNEPLAWQMQGMSLVDDCYKEKYRK